MIDICVSFFLKFSCVFILCMLTGVTRLVYEQESINYKMSYGYMNMIRRRFIPNTIGHQPSNKVQSHVNRTFDKKNKKNLNLFSSFKLNLFLWTVFYFISFFRCCLAALLFKTWFPIRYIKFTWYSSGDNMIEVKDIY